jgi:hypothetical protein
MLHIVTYLSASLFAIVNQLIPQVTCAVGFALRHEGTEANDSARRRPQVTELGAVIENYEISVA